LWFKKVTWNWLYSRCKEKDDEIVRILKTKKSAHRLFGGIYFTFITTAGYIVLSKTDFLPPMLGGKKENIVANFWKDFPVMADPTYADSVKNYYLISLGYHCVSIVTLVSDHIKARRNDFVEMLLHHMITVSLFVMGYMTGISKMGAVTMFLHDIADIPTDFAKFSTEILGDVW